MTQNIIFFENIHLLNWIIWLTEHLPQTTLSIFNDILFGLKSAWNRIYPGVAGQGSNFTWMDNDQDDILLNKLNKWMFLGRKYIQN